MRFRGTVGTIFSMRPGQWMSVSTMPGRTELQRIPWPAVSRASPLVNVSTAAFDAP